MVLDVGPDDVGLPGHAALPLQFADGGSGSGAGGRGLGRPGPAVQRVAVPATTCAATGPLGSTTRASRWPICWLLPRSPTTPTTRCGWPTATRGRPQVVEAVAKRFGVAVVDVFGSTEGGIALDRSGGVPRGSVGKLRQGIKVVDPDGNEREPAAVLRRRRPSGERRAVRGRDRQRRGRGPVRGLLPQRGGHGPDHPQRVVLERRPRVRRRRRLGVLRGAHLGLAPGGRRELPGRTHRSHRGPPSRRDDGLGLRRARCGLR